MARRFWEGSGGGDAGGAPRAGAPARVRDPWRVVLVVSLCVLVASAAALGAIALSYFQGQQKYARIADDAHMAASEGSIAPFAVDWDALRAINPDVVAWAFIPGTNVNYPVVRGADNEYYLTHDFEGDAGWLAEYGAVFMDYRNDPDWRDEGYFFYGHHMRDGSMFADIAALDDQARFDGSREVYLLSPTCDFRLRAFALVHCAADDPLVQTSFATQADREAYVQDKIGRSTVDVGDVPAARDITQFFAFATCDDVSSGRYVLYTYVEEAAVSGDGA